MLSELIKSVIYGSHENNSTVQYYYKFKNIITLKNTKNYPNYPKKATTKMVQGSKNLICMMAIFSVCTSDCYTIEFS